MNYIKCFDEKYVMKGRYEAPFDMEVDCYYVRVVGIDLSGMVLRGKCKWLVFVDVEKCNKVDLSGFMELEIGVIDISFNDVGLLKLLELKCKKIICNDKKLEKIMNKYVEEEPDPLMRDIQGFKLEMAVNGYGDRL